MISIARYFYSNVAPKVILLLVLCAVAVPAQQKKKVEGPRATALAVMTPDGKKVARLIPICVRDNGELWDASIYHADPRPMALDAGVVYELEKTGAPIGYFTVNQAVQESGAWIALGRFDSGAGTTRSASRSRGGDEDRPVLRRSKPSDTGSSAPPQAQAPASPPSTPEEDRDRPVLHRGKPAPETQAAVPSPSPSPKPAAGQLAPAKAEAPAPKPQLVPAVSDAGGPEPHPYTFEMGADQQLRIRKAMSAAAEQAVVKQAAGAALRFEYLQADLRFFDTDTNNSAVAVLTAHISGLPAAPAHTRGAPKTAPHAPAREFYVTVIGREDLNLELHPVFLRVVEARNLDIDGRLELIDAVDVDGDRRGELLFQRVIGKNITYLVLKPGLSQTRKIFDSAGE